MAASVEGAEGGDCFEHGVVVLACFGRGEVAFGG